MSEYNAKNYNEQGGDVTHIGGRLVFEKVDEIIPNHGVTRFLDESGETSADRACPFAFGLH